MRFSFTLSVEGGAVAGGALTEASTGAGAGAVTAAGAGASGAGDVADAPL
jgi:hypothetical protein